MVKSYKSIDEQINLLAERGLIIENPNFAKQLLGNVSYYRLSSYRFPIFNKSTNSYLQGSTIKDLKRYYERDTQYKSLLYYILQFIEVTFRTQLIYNFSKKDPYFYIERDNFDFGETTGEQKKIKYALERKAQFFDKIKKTIKNTNNIHIAFYQEKHDQEKSNKVSFNQCNYRKNNCSSLYKSCTCYPESWVALENFDFGQLIDIYKKLKKDKFQIEKNNIVNFFTLSGVNINYNDLFNMLEDIKRIRNIIAHHDKIIDRYSYKDSVSIAFLVKYYKNNSDVLDLLKNNIAEYRATFLPYFLVIKYFLDVMFANNFLSEFEETDFVKTFLSISKSSFYKELLSLEKLNDNIFDPYISSTN